MHRFLHSLCGRALALGLCALTGLACVPAEMLDPESGLSVYRTPGLVPVPGGYVDAAGGNLALIRTDLSIDTPLGNQSFTVTYNSANGLWQWSHRVRYDGSIFVDASGAVFDLSGVPGAAPIEGTIWERVDGNTIQTKGGLAHHFAPDGTLEHVRWSSLDYPRITFALGEIAHCTAAIACTPIVALTQGPDGQPLSLTDLRTGRQARFEYDAAGRLIVARSPGDVAAGRPGTRYEYSALGARLTASVSSEGERVEYAYSPEGRVVAVTSIGEQNPSHTFRYFGKNSAGRFPTLHTNPLGGRTRYAFDAQRRLLRVARLDAWETTDLSWSGLRPTRELAPGGLVSEFTFEDDRLLSWSQPSGNVVQLEYAPGGLNLEAPEQPPLLRRADLLGPIEERSYDPQGRVLTVTNGALEVSTRSYAGASVDSITRLGLTTSFPVFGSHGHWLTAALNGQTLATRVFDPVGNPTVPRSELREGGVLASSHDADRHPTAIAVAHSDDAGHVTDTSVVSITRRSDGQISYIARPGGGDHAFDYDEIGRMIGVRERVDALWQTTAIEYDAAGHQTARERANGMREEYEYDAYGRMTRQRVLRDGQVEGEALFTWHAGRLVARYDSLRDESEIYSYDGAGRLISTTFGHGESISREYDLRGRVTAEVFTVPGVGVVADLGYAYDGADRPLRLIDRAAGEVLVEDIWLDGLPRSTSTANGLVRSYAYDAQARLIDMQTIDAVGNVVESTTLSRTTELAPPRLMIATATTTPLASSEEQYWLPNGLGLSPTDQLVGKRLFGWNDGASGAQAFAWDALGNPADTAAGDAFTTNAEGNRLLSADRVNEAGAVAYVYDDAGFAIQRDGVPIGWNASGRLVSFGSDTLVWDLSGRLVEATVSGVTREFRLFGGRVESSLTSLGALDLGIVSIHLGTGERRHRHADFRGNVSFVSDDDGSVVAHHRYGPYGLDASWGEAGGSAFERRSGFGPFVLMGARVLDPLVGRFLSPDPVLQPLNQYAYTLGNPVGFEDRDGRHMAPRQALMVGMMIATIAVGLFIVGAIVLGAPVVYLTAAGAAYAVTNGIVTAILFVDEFGPRDATQAGALTSPRPPPPPAPPRPDGGGDAAPAPQMKVLTLEAAVTPSCTPLAAALPWGRSPMVGLLLLISNGLLGLAWWRCGRRGGV